MKTLIFFFALLFSFLCLFYLIIAAITAIGNAIVDKRNKSDLNLQLILGIISVLLWTLFYHFNSF